MPTDHVLVTERARKLRAQYALQAQSLRTRIDLRTNRIPTSIRKASMGELLERHSGLSMPNRMGPLEIMKPSESVNGPPALPNRIVISEDSELVSIPFSRGTKRKRYPERSYAIGFANLQFKVTQRIM